MNINIYTGHTICSVCVRINKYKYKWCNKNELKIYNVVINLRGDYIKAIKMPHDKKCGCLIL